MRARVTGGWFVRSSRTVRAIIVPLRSRLATMTDAVGVLDPSGVAVVELSVEASVSLRRADPGPGEILIASLCGVRVS